MGVRNVTKSIFCRNGGQSLAASLVVSNEFDEKNTLVGREGGGACIGDQHLHEFYNLHLLSWPRCR